MFSATETTPWRLSTAPPTLFSQTVSLGTHPQSIAIDLESDQIYVANQRTANVTVIGGKTNLPVVKVDAGTIPFAFGIDPAAHLIYVANFGSNNVTVIRGPER